jgi:hypothetical protein
MPRNELGQFQSPSYEDGKVCSRCQVLKSTSEFYQPKARRIASWCKACYVEYGKTPQRKQASLKYARKRLYGVTPDVWNFVFEKQEKVCGICGSPVPSRNNYDWNTDHDHDTDQFRGILCHTCNSILRRGVTSEILRKAAEYLDSQIKIEVI